MQAVNVTEALIKCCIFVYNYLVSQIHLKCSKVNKIDELQVATLRK